MPRVCAASCVNDKAKSNAGEWGTRRSAWQLQDHSETRRVVVENQFAFVEARHRFRKAEPEAASGLATALVQANESPAHFISRFFRYSGAVVGDGKPCAASRAVENEPHRPAGQRELDCVVGEVGECLEQ